MGTLFLAQCNLSSPHILLIRRRVPLRTLFQAPSRSSLLGISPLWHHLRSLLLPLFLLMGTRLLCLQQTGLPLLGTLLRLLCRPYLQNILLLRLIRLSVPRQVVGILPSRLRDLLLPLWGYSPPSPQVCPPRTGTLGTSLRRQTSTDSKLSIPCAPQMGLPVVDRSIVPGSVQSLSLFPKRKSKKSVLFSIPQSSFIP